MMDQQQHHINSNDIEFGEMQVPGSIPTVQLQPPRLQIYHKGIDTSHENTAVKNNSNGPGAENGSLHKTVRYRECLKNHAASIGSHAVDGCGEFMAGEEEEDAMKCQACGCHRNFHRREAEGEWSYGVLRWPRSGGHVPEGGHVPVPEDGHVRGHVLVMPEDGHLPGYGRRVSAAKKRFRTKFTGEQKEKMLGFAQRLGWRIQKQDEGAVQQFCNEVGVRRHVLKVWMHNNKHIMVKKE